MKKIIQKSFVLALMLMGLTSLAREKGPFLKVNEKGGKEFFLFIDEATANADEALISLKDVTGEILYSENLTRGNQYRKLFDLNALPKGEYILQIEDGTRIKTWPLNITEEGLNLHNADNKDFYKPQIIEQGNNKVGVSMFNKSKSSGEVSIFDSKRNLMFSESLPSELVVQRMYDLSQLQAGSYDVALKIDGRRFTKTVVIK